MSTISNATNIPRWNPDEQQPNDPATTFALVDLMPRPGAPPTSGPVTLPAPNGGTPLNIPGPSNTAPGAVPGGQPAFGVGTAVPMDPLIRLLDNAYTELDRQGVPRNQQSIGSMPRAIYETTRNQYLTSGGGDNLEHMVIAERARLRLIDAVNTAGGRQVTIPADLQASLNTFNAALQNPATTQQVIDLFGPQPERAFPTLTNNPQQPAPVETPAPAPAPTPFTPQYPEVNPYDPLNRPIPQVTPPGDVGDFSMPTAPFNNAPSPFPAPAPREWTPIDESGFPDPANADGPRWEDAPADAAALVERLLNGGRPANTDPVEWNRTIDPLTGQAVTSVGPGNTPNNQPGNQPSGGFPGGSGMGYNNAETPAQHAARTEGTFRERLEELGLNDTNKPVHQLATEFVHRVMNTTALDNDLPQARRVLEAIVELPGYYNSQTPLADRFTSDAALRSTHRNATGVGLLQPGQSTDIVRPDGSILASVMRKQNGEYAVYSNIDGVGVRYPNSTHHVQNGTVRDASPGSVLQIPGVPPITLSPNPAPAPTIIMPQPPATPLQPLPLPTTPTPGTSTSPSNVDLNPDLTGGPSVTDNLEPIDFSLPTSAPVPTVEELQQRAVRADNAVREANFIFNSTLPLDEKRDRILELIDGVPASERGALYDLLEKAGEGRLPEGQFRDVFPVDSNPFKSFKGPNEKSTLGSDIITGFLGSDFTVGADGNLATTQSFMEQHNLTKQDLVGLLGPLSSLLQMTGQRGMADKVSLIQSGANLYLDHSTMGILNFGLGMAGRYGNEDVQNAARLANTGFSLYKYASKPGPAALVQVAADVMSYFDVNPYVSYGMQAAATIAGIAASGPLAPVTASIAFAQLMMTIAGKPSKIDLSTMINGEEVRVEYGISGREYRYYLDADGMEPKNYSGMIYEQDGRFYLKGAFGYEGFNDWSGDGAGALEGTIMVRDQFVQRWQPDGMMQDREIDPAFARQFLNGQKEAGISASLGDPLFDIVAEKLGLVQEVRYVTPASTGLMEVDGGMTIFRYPTLGDFQKGHDHVRAHFDNPLIAGKHQFRDPVQAAMFADFGLMSAMMVGGDVELARNFGGFDAQRVLDHAMENFDILAQRPLFDMFGYLAGNPDVQNAIGANLMQAMQHYLDFGVHEGRGFSSDPFARARAEGRVFGIASFDEAAYLALNPDVAAAVARGEISARAHYETFGFDEGRAPYFDQQAYLAANPDVAAHVAAGGGSALDHWVQFGQHEGRSLAPAAVPVAQADHPDHGFDERAYLAANPDVARAIAEGTMDSAYGHFQRHGQLEGRQFFDEQAYLAQHQGVAEAVANGTMDSGLGHWERHGQHEGFGIAVSQNAPIAPVAEHAPAPAPTFEEAYFAANPDVAASGMSAAEHYHSAGAEEGRTW